MTVQEEERIINAIRAEMTLLIKQYARIGYKSVHEGRMINSRSYGDSFLTPTTRERVHAIKPASKVPISVIAHRCEGGHDVS